MDLNFENVFKISVLCMRITRSHPDIKRDSKWAIQFIMFHGVATMVFLLIMYNIIFINLRDKDFSQTCKNGILAIVYVVISFEYSLMLWRQQYLLELMDNIKKDYDQAKLLNANEQEIIQEYARQGTSVCKMWLFIDSMVLGLFPLKSIVMFIFYWITDEFRLVPLYDLVYPSFIEDNKENVLVFMITYTLLLFYGAYTTVMMTAFVPLGLIFMVHACGQLEVARKRIEAIFKNYNNDNAEEGFIDVVKRLQNIYDFVDRTKLCFRVSYEVILKSSTIVLPVACYEVLEALKVGELSLEFITFIIGAFMQSSCPCYYSELLMAKGEDLRFAMYSCGWEKMFDRGIRSTVKIVLLRALRPIAIQTLFRTVCLNTLSELFHQSYAIFNLMNAAWS